MLADLRRQQEALGPKAARAQLALFARERFSARLRAAAAEEGVLLVSAADLFAPLRRHRREPSSEARGR
jgi:hypothetical protein